MPLHTMDSGSVRGASLPRRVHEGPDSNKKDGCQRLAAINLERWKPAGTRTATTGGRRPIVCAPTLNGRLKSEWIDVQNWTAFCVALDS